MIPYLLSFAFLMLSIANIRSRQTLNIRTTGFPIIPHNLDMQIMSRKLDLINSPIQSVYQWLLLIALVRTAGGWRVSKLLLPPVQTMPGPG